MRQRNRGKRIDQADSCIESYDEDLEVLVVPYIVPAKIGRVLSDFRVAQAAELRAHCTSEGLELRSTGSGSIRSGLEILSVSESVQAMELESEKDVRGQRIEADEEIQPFENLKSWYSITVVRSCELRIERVGSGQTRP